MTPDEIRALGDDLALAVKARGQFLADQARASGLGEKGAGFITQCFTQAADVVTIRTIQRQISAMDGEKKKGAAR